MKKPRRRSPDEEARSFWAKFKTYTVNDGAIFSKSLIQYIRCQIGRPPFRNRLSLLVHLRVYCGLYNLDSNGLRFCIFGLWPSLVAISLASGLKVWMKVWISVSCKQLHKIQRKECQAPSPSPPDLNSRIEISLSLSQSNISNIAMLGIMLK